MSNQVKRWDVKEHYLDGSSAGVPVSDKFATWEEAEEVRNRLRAEDPQHYYNIVHYTRCAIVDSASGIGTRTIVYPPADEYEHKEMGE